MPRSPVSVARGRQSVDGHASQRVNTTPSPFEGSSRFVEEQLRLVIESSPAGLVIVNSAGKIVLVNRQTELWFGYAGEELLGSGIEVLVPSRLQEQHRVDREEFLAAPRPRPMGRGQQLSGRRKDGSEFPVDVSLHPMRVEDETLVLAYIVDLTERRRVEQESQRIHAMERLALLGQLAGGVAHEIRNPLAVICNAAYYLQMIQDQLDSDARESIAEIQHEVERANRIVGELLDYVRESPQRFERFDVVARIRSFVGRHGGREAPPILVKAPADELPVRADPDQIERILANLIRNSQQATEGDKPVHIEIVDDGGSVVIDVVDSGVGVDESNRPHIFEPLFTTKPVGFGLGLAVSRRYAEGNNGSLELVTRSGPGATFRLRLPRVD